MVIREYGAEVWDSIELHAGLETYDWTDSEFYPDEDFFDMVDVVVSLPNMDSEKVCVFCNAAAIYSPNFPLFVGPAFVFNPRFKISQRQESW